MHRVFFILGSASVILGVGCTNGEAQDDDGPGAAAPVELYTCNYTDGKGPADLDAVTAKWNAWADQQGFDDYSAWTLTPFYMGPNQDFDFAWLGVSPNARALGAAQDKWIATGGAVAAEFESMSTCDSHANFAALQFKAPPERDDPENVVLSFSDCKIEEGKTFNDVEPALKGWSEYRTGHGSDSGMWVFFPAYGGGGEEFDFKFVASYQDLESNGADWDQYSEAGWQKAQELFGTMLDCDSARVYLAKNRRMGADDE